MLSGQNGFINYPFYHSTSITFISPSGTSKSLLYEIAHLSFYTGRVCIDVDHQRRSYDQLWIISRMFVYRQNHLACSTRMTRDMRYEDEDSRLMFASDRVNMTQRRGAMTSRSCAQNYLMRNCSKRTMSLSVMHD